MPRRYRRRKATIPEPAKEPVDLKSRLAVAMDIKMKVARYYAKKKWAVNFEVGVERHGARRADVVCMAFNGYTVIVEVKSCMADFVADHKWKSYKPYCNQFYFAVNSQTWAKLKERVTFPPSVGVLVVDHSSLVLKVAKKSKKRDVDPEILLSMALRLAYRGAQFRSLSDVRKGGRFK